MLRTTTSVALTILAAAALAQAQQPAAPAAGGRGAPQPQSIQQVKPGLYMITGAGGNTDGPRDEPGIDRGGRETPQPGEL